MIIDNGPNQVLYIQTFILQIKSLSILGYIYQIGNQIQVPCLFGALDLRSLCPVVNTPLLLTMGVY